MVPLQVPMAFDEHFKVDIPGIVKDILRAAKKDKVITDDESALIKRIKADLAAYERAVNRYRKKHPLTQKQFAIMQNKLRDVLVNALKTADIDEKITADEKRIILIVADVVEDTIYKQMTKIDELTR